MSKHEYNKKMQTMKNERENFAPCSTTHKAILDRAFCGK